MSDDFQMSYFVLWTPGEIRWVQYSILAVKLIVYEIREHMNFKLGSSILVYFDRVHLLKAVKMVTIQNSLSYGWVWSNVSPLINRFIYTPLFQSRNTFLNTAGKCWVQKWLFRDDRTTHVE